MRLPRFRALFACCLALLSLGAVAAIGCRLPETSTGRHELTVAVLDVGQALAVAVVTSDGHALLYDAGNSREDAEQVILPFLRRRGFERLDVVVLSHPDQDHVGGMPAVLESVEVDLYVDPVLPSTNRSYMETLRLVRDRKIRAVRAEPGRVLELGTAVRVHVLWPARPLLSDPQGEISDNDNSVVLLVEHGAVRVLLPGDLEDRGETALLAREGAGLRASVLVVGHHGSRTSSSEPFLRAVQPAVAIVSAGRDNPYGHPHRETLQRLRRVGAHIYRTDVDGTVVVRSDGQQFQVLAGEGRP
ncbi:MAG: ComEC/Rec2 family competence protein [Thermomicrobium sp.]|nr:ComEC/Rec2 family competence protein [Thermomicrobium sp.]